MSKNNLNRNMTGWGRLAVPYHYNNHDDFIVTLPHMTVCFKVPE